MTRTLMAAVAVSGLMLSTALAQTSSPSTMGKPNGSTSAAPSSSSSMGANASNAQAISTQSPDQWLASKFNGTDVIGADNNKIGDVTDVLFDKNGKVDAVVVGVGGFLGIGKKDVALPLSAFQVVPPKSAGNDSSSDMLRLSMTKDQLTQLAEFKPLSSTSTTGAGSNSTPRSGGSSSPTPMAPNSNR